MIVAQWLDGGMRRHIERIVAPTPADPLLGFLAAGAELSPPAVEALALYVHNQQSVAQEIFQPGGASESRDPPNPDVLRADTSRLLYQAVAWYQQMEVQLRRIGGDWECWAGGGFGQVRRDGAETVCWIVRDLEAGPRGRWTLQIERDGALEQSATFEAVADAVGGKAGGSRDERVLVDAYRVYARRIERVQHLLRHLAALGMRSTQEYRGWCHSRGLADELLKNPQQRRRELELGQRRSGGRWFAETVARLCAGQPVDDRAEYLSRIARELAKGLRGAARDAYRELLLVADERANLFAMQPAIPRLGPVAGNSFVEAVAQLARHHRRWLRRPAEWTPQSHDPRQQFGALARHLLADYPVPAFMDAAWCLGRKQRAQRQQAWFVHLAGGRNIRTAAGLPLALSKRMAHEFSQAPDHYTVDEALRWGQVVGQGGDPELVAAILGTQLGASFANEDFWGTVVRFFATNPLLDPSYVGPIVDYIDHRKYQPQELVQPGGFVETAPPPEPNLSMKSRSVPKLLEQVEAWHRHLNHEDKAAAGHWRKSGIADFGYKEKDTLYGGELVWIITELLSKAELKTEGRALRHCVSSYADKCKIGSTSIWSLQVRNGQGETIRLVTIALNPRNRNITQVRSRHNLKPVQTAAGESFSAQVDQRFAWYLRRGKDMLRAWVQQEGLGHRGGDLHAWIR